MSTISSTSAFEIFLLNPQHLSDDCGYSGKKEKGIKILAVAGSVLFGLVTLGIVHSSYWLKNKISKKTSFHAEKINRLSTKAIIQLPREEKKDQSSNNDHSQVRPGQGNIDNYSLIDRQILRAGQIGPIEFVSDGVYTAEAITPRGEKIYFAMETIENSDKVKWESYKNSASILVNGGCWDVTIGSLVEIGSRVNNITELREFLKTRTHPDYWTSDQAKFERLCTNLQEHNVTVDSPKAKELLAIPHASNGVNVSQQTHMVYVSKSPVTGRIDFTAKSKGFNGYVDKYGDLIMSVGVTISDIVENRGIFRNPWSVVEGGYAGISMMTHSFTCMAVENNWPEIKTFRVRPLKKMGELFLNSLPKNQVTVNGIPGDMYDQGFEYEQDVRVPVKVLAEIHRFG